MQHQSDEAYARLCDQVFPFQGFTEAYKVQGIMRMQKVFFPRDNQTDECMQVLSNSLVYIQMCSNTGTQMRVYKGIAS